MRSLLMILSLVCVAQSASASEPPAPKITQSPGAVQPVGFWNRSRPGYGPTPRTTGRFGVSRGSANGGFQLPTGRRTFRNRYFGSFNNRYYGPQYGYF